MGEKLNFETLSVHDTPQKSLGFLLWRISTLWRTSLESVLKNLGLTHPQFVVLAVTGWLTREGKLVTQIAIGKMAGLDPNTNSQIIKGLEKKRLVQRMRSLDGRAKNVSLTSAGADALGRALPAVEGADAKFFETLNAKESQLLLKIFQKIYK